MEAEPSQDDHRAASASEPPSDAPDQDTAASPAPSGGASSGAAPMHGSPPPLAAVNSPARSPSPAPAAPEPMDAEGQEVDPEARLNELEAKLGAPDAIMEPGIFNHLRNYVVAKGHPQHAVELLTDNYAGYAQMAALACSWLRLVDDVDEEQEGGDAGTGAGGSGAVLSPEEKGKRVPLSAMDEAYFLRQLCLERFDPKRFAGIFSAGGSGAPKWLSTLITDREGRGLIYDLAVRYPNSLLLNFAVQRILLQPGGDVEAAAVGASLDAYFGVYHRLLGVRLRQAADAQDEESLARLCKELCEGAAASQHAYLHAQLMLRELASETGAPWAPRFARIAQELEAAVPGPVPWKMHRWFDPEAALPSTEGGSGGGDDERTAAAVGEEEEGSGAAAAAWAVSDILASNSGGSLPTTSDVIKLHRLYCPASSGTADTATEGDTLPNSDSKTLTQPSRRPSASLLRHSRFIEALLAGVFAPGRQLQPEAQAAFVGLLAIAVAAPDDPAAEETPEDAAAVAAVAKALDSAAAAAHKALRDEILTAEEVAAGEAGLKEPCAAAGVLGMLRSQLGSPQYWAAAYHIHREPPFLPLLLSIVRQQPPMHGEVLSLISTALGAMGDAPSGPDVARALMRVAVALVAAGRVEEVLSWGEAWARNADAGLVRCLLFGLLEIAAPPYSPRFAAAVVRLGALGGALRQRMGSREWSAKVALLAEFSAACATDGVKFEPPLGREETSFLRELAICLRTSGLAVPKI